MIVEEEEEQEKRTHAKGEENKEEESDNIGEKEEPSQGQDDVEDKEDRKTSVSQVPPASIMLNPVDRFNIDGSLDSLFECMDESVESKNVSHLLAQNRDLQTALNAALEELKNVQIAIQDKHEVIETQAVEIADLKEKLKAAYEDIQKVKEEKQTEVRAKIKNMEELNEKIEKIADLRAEIFRLQEEFSKEHTYANVPDVSIISEMRSILEQEQKSKRLDIARISAMLEEKRVQVQTRVRCTFS
ncbi:hypothetical protein GUITHDRAFT_106631 [Guillardia theta CCMP2712]|uniref:Uncharacterized protein n=1 Tax=Guillardia theta (strain CCMP2712) TaxID=905079 RepID=L1JGJ3_GUITC|nr:hypothetical protein GUITHDRAFT_106631 [Guillardia theta CCMP2712]EKX47643.1 hypothetical protein GUITHDRAFT_106631 [Guillardia theta CCMP2712]|eukprot:XP_005834623.1 hypothetical protein GUITHDRAFT_106631 [Guillardia theta CCMP2712]